MNLRPTRRTLALGLAAACAIPMLSATAGAAEFGTRAYSMGGAFTGVADDFSTILYNPAGLGHASFEVGLGIGSRDFTNVSRFQALLSNPTSFEDDMALDLTMLSGASIGAFGAAIAADGSLVVRTADCSGADLCADGEYMTQLVFGMGRSAASLPVNLADLRVGLAFKRLDGRRVEYSRTVNTPPTTYTAQTTDWRGQGYGIDFGATFKASDIVTVGVAAHDIIASITWTGTQTEETRQLADDSLAGPQDTDDLDAVTERPGPVYRAGIGIRPPLFGGTIAADIASDGTVRFGVEKQLFFNAVSVRLGQANAQGASTTTAGLGFSLGPVRIDAAVGSSDGFSTYHTMIEGSVRF